MPPRGPVLTVIITAATEGLDAGLKEAEGKLVGFSGKAGKAGGKAAGLAKAAAPIAAVAAATIKLGKAGDKANTDIESFNKAMMGAGASSEDLGGALGAAVKGATDMAFSGGEARDSLVSLQTATGDAEESARLLAIAQDVARLSGTDLTTASDAVAKAYAGQDRALRALLPGLPEAATGLESIANAEELAAGQSEIFADSAEGLGIKGKAAFKGIAISIGKALGPAVVALFEALLPVLEIIGTLVNALLPLLLPILKNLEIAFKNIATILNKVSEWLKIIVDWVKKLLAPLGELLDKVRSLLDPLRDLSNMKFFGGGGIRGKGAPAAMSAFNAGLTEPVGTTQASGVTINIYGDPSVIEAKVTKALRDYARRNGVGAVFTPNRD